VNGFFGELTKKLFDAYLPNLSEPWDTLFLPKREGHTYLWHGMILLLHNILQRGIPLLTEISPKVSQLHF
jgi:hypothetical protein